MVTLPSLPLSQIKYAELRDSGQYQCQVNTEPKMSESVFLSVRGECYQLILQLLNVVQLVDNDRKMEALHKEVAKGEHTKKGLTKESEKDTTDNPPTPKESLEVPNELMNLLGVQANESLTIGGPQARKIKDMFELLVARIQDLLLNILIYYMLISQCVKSVNYRVINN